MWEQEWKRLWLALRGGIVLGLGLTAVWFLALTAGGGIPDKLAEMMQFPGIGVALLEQQTGISEETLTGTGLQGWGRWVVGQSALLQEQILWRPESESQALLPPQPQPQIPEDPESGEISLTAPQQAGTDVLEMTSRGEESKGAVWEEGVWYLNKTGKTLPEGMFSPQTPVPVWKDGPQILILHTHGSESYTQSGEDTYEESDPYRTTDCTQNVVRVGEEMAMELRSHGFRVIHDTNLYDYPSYNGAYDRSGAAVEQWLEQYPSIQIILDVHRDALVGEGEQPYALVSTEAGKKVAQVMLVVGSDLGGADHPNWKENLSFAAFLQRGTMKRCTSLVRPLCLRGSRFNQQASPFSLLVEVGGHGNTLQQAIDGGRLFAAGMARSLQELAPLP